VTPQICDCGTCLTCQSRERGRKWRAAHPGAKAAHRAQMREFRKANPQVRKGPFIHPTAARMDAVAEAVWARHAAPRGRDGPTL